MNKKPKKVSKILSYTEHFLILVYAITGCVSNSVFASLVAIPIRITSSAIGLKICAKAAEIKKCRYCILVLPFFIDDSDAEFHAD